MQILYSKSNAASVRKGNVMEQVRFRALMATFDMEEFNAGNGK